jgi:hypothetical protein
MALSSGSIERRIATLVSVSESIQAQGGGAVATRGRGPLPEELMPDAMHFVTALLEKCDDLRKFHGPNILFSLSSQ